MNRANTFREQAEACERQASRTADSAVREQFLALARQWRELAQSAEFLQWKTDGGLAPLPPASTPPK
jgi:hypothetical protein